MAISSPERIYRDSVHNIIRIASDDDEGRLLTALIDTPEFQRLRRIRLLGLAYFAYQSAEHSRFTHSLGAFHLATRILDRLAAKHDITAGDRLAVRAAALLHDVGHGAFSHVVESILDFHHEDYSVRTILDPQTEINRVLTSHSSGLASDVAAIVRGDFRVRALGQLVSSQLDVDRMDYLLRDSLMTGAKYGIFDLEWIIKSIDVDEENDRLFVSAPGIAAVEDYLQARYYMFRQVYFHRTLRSAETILSSLLRRAIELYATGGDVWHLAGSPLEVILAGKPLTLDQHLATDDIDLTFHIKQWQTSSDAVLADLSARFLDRRLFKAFDLDMSDDDRVRFLAAAREYVRSSGFDPNYYFIEDAAEHADHFFYTRDDTDPKNLIFVEHGYAKPEMREISEVSAAVRGLQSAYRAHRVCFPAELKGEIQRLYHGA